MFFAKLDKESGKSARKALRTVKGVDAKGSKVRAKKGEISVKLTGGEKDTVKVADLLSALENAGIKASLTKK